MNSASGLMANDAFLMGLYGGLPKFDEVNIQQINLNWNGPCASIVFDLNEFPSDPPKKWNKFNTVQLEISFFPLRKVNIDVFSGKNLCAVNIEKVGAEFFVEITGGAKASFVASSISIDRVSAYFNMP